MIVIDKNITTYNYKKRQKMIKIQSLSFLAVLSTLYFGALPAYATSASLNTDEEFKTTLGEVNPEKIKELRALTKNVFETFNAVRNYSDEHAAADYLKKTIKKLKLPPLVNSPGAIKHWKNYIYQRIIKGLYPSFDIKKINKRWVYVYGTSMKIIYNELVTTKEALEKNCSDPVENHCCKWAFDHWTCSK
jgi:hypothetical protein